MSKLSLDSRIAAAGVRGEDRIDSRAYAYGLNVHQLGEIYRETARREGADRMVKIGAIRDELEAGTYRFDVEIAALRMLSDLNSPL